MSEPMTDEEFVRHFAQSCVPAFHVWHEESIKGWHYIVCNKAYSASIACSHYSENEAWRLARQAIESSEEYARMKSSREVEE